MMIWFFSLRLYNSVLCSVFQELIYSLFARDAKNFSINYNPAGACAEGTQTIKVTFTPSSCVENYDATLTLYNGKTVTINLTGARVRNSGTVSEITWTGAVDTNWDNRANWIKADGNVLSAADVLDEKLKSAWIEGIPLKRAGSTKDVANACLFLASDMSTYVTGQVLGVDGGMGC